MSTHAPLPDLDEEDLKILRELQKDGRAGYSDISRETGIPTSTVHDKIKKMVKNGVIERFTVRLDRRAMGVNITSVIGVGTTTKFYRQVAEELVSVYEVSEVYGTTAEFDLMVKVQAESRDDLNRIVTHIRSMEGIDDIFITSVLEVFKEEPVYPRLKAN